MGFTPTGSALIEAAATGDAEMGADGRLEEAIGVAAALLAFEGPTLDKSSTLSRREFNNMPEEVRDLIFKKFEGATKSPLNTKSEKMFGSALTSFRSIRLPRFPPHIRLRQDVQDLSFPERKFTRIIRRARVCVFDTEQWFQ